VADDEDPAQRIEGPLSTRRGLSEEKMFGGPAFLVGRNMTLAASGQGGILVRVDPGRSDQLEATTTASVRCRGASCAVLALAGERVAPRHEARGS
jgi:hypothetical protein